MTLFKHAKIVEAEDIALAELFEAFETSHKRHLVDGYDEDLILSNDGANLSAVCRSARLCWAHFLAEELAAHLRYNPSDRTINQSVFLLTLVDVQCARPSAQFNVNLNPIIRQLRKGLRGLDFVAVIEPGLYSHISIPGNLQQSRCISWHLHALVWGLTRREAKRLVARLNRRGKYIPVAPKQKGAHQRKVRKSELAETLAYLLKRPKTAYRLALCGDASGTGEQRYKQYRSALRPGEHLTLYLQLKHLSLTDMWIAGSEGRKILGSVKRRYRAAIRRGERMTGRRTPAFGRASIFDRIND